MSVATTTGETGAKSAQPARGRIIGYWVASLFVAVNATWSGVVNLLHGEPLFGLLVELGYPPHFATILGAWKLLGAGAMLVPRRPLLKEWAYAGFFIEFTSAAVAHVAVGDGPATLVGPALNLVALAASWLLRPSSRRLAVE